MTVQIPAHAIDHAKGDDVAVPTETLLVGLQLLPDQADSEEATGFASAFLGPPQSVALIEAGATALSKWWAAGLGASASVVWGSIVTFWSKSTEPTQHVLLWVAGIATVAAVLAIGYIVGSDVRGRSAAAVATIESRANVAITMLRLAGDAYDPRQDTISAQVVALPGQPAIRHIAKRGDDEIGWRAIAVSVDATQSLTYLVVKGRDQEWVGGGGIEFA